ncbi:MAG: hypothetical protein R6U44_07600, partial [Archaeoglobaceae archaeon]
DEMQEAMAMQARAERERRARIIRADAEMQAAKKLTDASEVMSGSKGTMMLRTLQTINDAATQEGTTILFPLPLEMLEYFKVLPKKKEESSEEKHSEE